MRYILLMCMLFLALSCSEPSQVATQQEATSKVLVSSLKEKPINRKPCNHIHHNDDQGTPPKGKDRPYIIPEDKYPVIFNANSQYYSDGFDFPVGKPNAYNYYKAQSFGQNDHLGDDWNGRGGGNTDLGDPVYSTANGLVTYAENICCGWGKTVRIVHYLPYHSDYQYVESIYSHLNNIDVKVGQLVTRGEYIGTIGNADGMYLAHLHFEMRDFINMSIGPGYSRDKMGYMNPTDFIEWNRP